MNKSTQKRVLSGRDFNQFVFVVVPAFGYELRSFIQGRIWGSPQDGQLCLAEKLAILRVDPDMTLNKRSKLVAKCRHHNK